MTKSDVKYTDNVVALTDDNGKTIFYFANIFTPPLTTHRANDRLLFRPMITKHYLNHLQIFGTHPERALIVLFWNLDF